MVRDLYPEYFTKTGQLKRTLGAGDKLRMRQLLLEEEGRDVIIISGSGKVADRHVFSCSQGHMWETLLSAITRKNSSGCPHCYGTARQSKEKYLERCREESPEGYEILDVPDFKNSKSILKYTCNLGHVTATTTIGDFLNKGVRCSTCANKAHDTLYFYRLRGTSIYKVGVTTHHRGHYRIYQVCSRLNTAPDILVFYKLDNPKRLESLVLQTFNHKLLRENLGDGSTEMLSLTIEESLEIVSFIKENTNG